MNNLFRVVCAVLFLGGMSLLPQSADPPAVPVVAVVSSDAATMVFLVPLVAKWEGKENRAYFDVVGVPTICFGHTRTVTADHVRLGRTMTDQECEALLRLELREYRDGVRSYASAETLQFRLPPRRDAAFASLGYNVGINGVGGSTAMRRLNSDDVVGACDALTWWNKAGGRVLRGLANRRAEEYTLCMVGT